MNDRDGLQVELVPIQGEQWLGRVLTREAAIVVCLSEEQVMAVQLQDWRPLYWLAAQSAVRSAR